VKVADDPAVRYVVREGTTPAAVIAFLSQHPGEWFASSDVLRNCGLMGLRSLRKYLDASVQAGFIRMRYESPGRISWSMGVDADIEPERRAAEKMDSVEATMRREMREPLDERHTMKLRSLFFSGDGIVTGDVSLLTAEAMQAARDALARKASSRFRGAEVDVFVARELRAISEAAIRARDNLRAAVEGML